MRRRFANRKPGKPLSFAVCCLHVTHEGYGVPAERFESFFEVIRDTFARLLGPDWSDAHHSAWTRTIEDLRQSAI
ncbi:MAG: globin [Hyphomonas sp.]